MKKGLLAKEEKSIINSKLLFAYAKQIFHLSVPIAILLIFPLGLKPFIFSLAYSALTAYIYMYIKKIEWTAYYYLILWWGIDLFYILCLWDIKY